MPGTAGKEADEHAAHHPSGSVPAAPAPAGYDGQMKMMQEMHQKMAAARTPEERAALMKAHMKTMQDGMGMMGQMRGGMMERAMAMDGGKGTMPMDQGTMKRRMDMMEMMMQMMVDREGMNPPATK
ncbi:MAG: hypothetical protein ABI699_20070 [Caldimonas sp.]